MRGESELLSVIGQIYEAAADPDRIADLSPLLAPHFGAVSSILHTCTKSSLEMPAIVSATENFDPWAWSAYGDYYHDRNTWFQRGIRKGPSVVVICEELMPHRELLRSEWYDYCRKVDWFHCLGIGVSIAEDLVGGLGFHRPRAAKPWDEADRKKAHFILPHLERALQIQHRIAGLVRERDIAFDVIDGLALGVLLVLADGRLLFANRVAERVLQCGHGLSASHGWLRAQDHRQQQNLERLIGEAARTSAGQGLCAGGTLSLPRIERQPLTLLVSPFRSEASGYGPPLPAAVVIFADPDRPVAASEKALRSAYQLTRAQARLLAALLKGQNLTEYAECADLNQHRQDPDEPGVPQDRPQPPRRPHPRHRRQPGVQVGREAIERAPRTGFFAPAEVLQAAIANAGSEHVPGGVNSHRFTTGRAPSALHPTAPVSARARFTPAA